MMYRKTNSIEHFFIWIHSSGIQRKEDAFYLIYCDKSSGGTNEDAQFLRTASIVFVVILQIICSNTSGWKISYTTLMFVGRCTLTKSAGFSVRACTNRNKHTKTLWIAYQNILTNKFMSQRPTKQCCDNPSKE